MADGEVTAAELAEAKLAHTQNAQHISHNTISRAEQEQRARWNPLRRAMAEIMESKKFEGLLGICIAFNFVIMVIETDQNASCALPEASEEDCSADEWLKFVGAFLLALYTIECCAKLYAFRLVFFASRWNNIDFVIVFLGLCDSIISQAAGDVIPNINMLRLFRLARLIRAVRVLTTFRELYLMVHGFASAMMSMFWGFVMMGILLTVWSMFAVEIIHPENALLDHSENPYCADAFSTVMMSNLQFFRTVVAGDSWGLCAIPLINRSPYLFPIFAGVLFTVQIGCLNLILAVIVEQAAQSREADQVRRHQEQKCMERDSRKTLMKLCSDIDTDNDGQLSLRELVEGFALDPLFAMHLQLLGIEAEMLPEVFSIMDRDRSGSLTFEEFIDTLHTTRTQDIKMLVTMVKFELVGQMHDMKKDIIAAIGHEIGSSVGKAVEGTSNLLQSSNASSLLPVPSQPSSVNPTGQEMLGQPQGTNQPEDLKLFLEMVRVQMSQMLDSVTNKVREYNVGEEKSKLDSMAFGGAKTTSLAPTFSPDGQWSVILKPDWQLLRSFAARERTVGPETKDPASHFGAFDAGLENQWQALDERNARQQPLSLRPTPLPRAASPYTCDPSICARHLEVISMRESSHGLPGRASPQHLQTDSRGAGGFPA